MKINYCPQVADDELGSYLSGDTQAHTARTHIRTGMCTMRSHARTYARAHTHTCTMHTHIHMYVLKLLSTTGT